MAAALVVLEEENRRGLRCERVFRGRVHPLDALFERYRMPRPVLLEIIDLLQPNIAHPTNRSHAIPCALQVLTAKGSLQMDNADTVHISQPSVSRIMTRVSAVSSTDEESDQLHNIST
jgi:hypothetical protein